MVELTDAPASTLFREADVLDQGVPPPGRAWRWQEKELRDAVEVWLRARWPEARIVHELVISRGEIRLDVAAVCVDRLIIVELKSFGDGMGRALHQIGMSVLCGDEVWLITDGRHSDDGDLLRYLMPGLGLATGAKDGPGSRFDRFPVTGIEVREEWARTAPAHPKAQLSLLWVNEMRAEAARHNVPCNSRSTAISLLRDMLRLMTPDEIRLAVCRQLRARHALWRADPPIHEDQATTRPAGKDEGAPDA